MLSVPSHSLDGKKIDPKHATPKSKSKANKTKKIFVGGVSQETSADEVKAYFNQFGKSCLVCFDGLCLGTWRGLSVSHLKCFNFGPGIFP